MQRCSTRRGRTECHRPNLSIGLHWILILTPYSSHLMWPGEDYVASSSCWIDVAVTCRQLRTLLMASRQNCVSRAGEFYPPLWNLHPGRLWAPGGNEGHCRGSLPRARASCWKSRGLRQRTVIWILDPAAGQEDTDTVGTGGKGQHWATTRKGGRVVGLTIGHKHLAWV